VTRRSQALLPKLGLRGATRPEPDFVEFWRTGADVIGIFSCAACGREVRSVRQLPDCPSCGGSLWEQTASSPFRPGTAPPQFQAEAWYQEDLESAAGLTRGLVVALLAAPLCWLVPIGLGYLLYALIR
jgi:hypothetical protein